MRFFVDNNLSPKLAHGRPRSEKMSPIFRITTQRTLSTQIGCLGSVETSGSC
jgi:hypothetical protein